MEVEGAQDDIYIPEEDTGQAMHLDKVKVQIEKAAGEGRRAQGKIVKILEHSVTEVVGTFEKSKKYGFVVPDNARYFMPDMGIKLWYRLPITEARKKVRRAK